MEDWDSYFEYEDRICITVSRGLVFFFNNWNAVYSFKLPFNVSSDVDMYMYKTCCVESFQLSSSGEDSFRVFVF